MRALRIGGVLALALIPAACGGHHGHHAHHAANSIEVTQAVASAPNGAVDVSVAFLTIDNGTDQADALIGAQSPAARSIELHEMIDADGVMAMRKVDAFATPAHSATILSPKGGHLMVFGLDPKLKPGDHAPLTLRFRSGKTISTQLLVTADAVSAFQGHGAHSDEEHEH